MCNDIGLCEPCAGLGTIWVVVGPWLWGTGGDCERADREGLESSRCFGKVTYGNSEG